MTGLARRETAALELTPDQVDLVKRTVAKGATNDELALFLYHAQKSGLDPLARQIHFVVRGRGDNRQGSIQTGIDGYRLIADRTGQYAGNDDPVFEGVSDGRPKKATVTVWKLVGGVRCPFTASARWSEYYPGDSNAGFMWRKMPGLMLGKAAEALALRKAFPAELSGLFVDEEMHQADGAIDTTVKESPSVGQTAVTGSAAIHGEPVRSDDQGSGDSSGSSPDPDPPLTGDRPCPHCGWECEPMNTANKNWPKWKCTNTGCTGHKNTKTGELQSWVSWHVNPWKPGGEFEQIVKSQAGSTDAQEGHASSTEPTAATGSDPEAVAPTSKSVEGGGDQAATSQEEPSNGTAPHTGPDSDASENGPEDPSPQDGQRALGLIEDAIDAGIVKVVDVIRSASPIVLSLPDTKPPTRRKDFEKLPPVVLVGVAEKLKLAERIPA